MVGSQYYLTVIDEIAKKRTYQQYGKRTIRIPHRHFRFLKKASGSLRINLAQYREMKEFTQFASDLDDATKRQLQHGQVLMELLKQPLNHPMSHADMVIILVVADAGILDDLNSKQVKKEETKLLDWFNENHSEISREINTTKKLDDNLKTRIITLAKQYRGQE